MENYDDIGELFLDFKMSKFFDVLESMVNAFCDAGDMYICEGSHLNDNDEVREIMLRGAKYYKKYALKEFKALQGK